MTAKVGEIIFLEDIGSVRVKVILASGAARVMDEDGRLWLIPKDRLFISEHSLFNFSPDLKKGTA